MEKGTKIVVLLLLLFFVTESFSQSTFMYMHHDRRFKYKLPLIGIGAGATIFRGDLGSYDIIQPQLSFNATVLKRITKKFYRVSGIMRNVPRNEDMFGWSINATKYFVASDYEGHGRATYFNSTGWAFDVRFHAFMEKYMHLYRTNRFSPYVSVGFGYILDKSGGAFSFPITVGTRYRISNTVELSLNTTHFMTTTDYMDWDYGYAPNDFSIRSPMNKKNDYFIYTSLTLYILLSEARNTSFY